MKFEIDVDETLLAATKKTLAGLLPNIELDDALVVKMMFRVGVCGMATSAMMDRDMLSSSLSICMNEDEWKRTEMYISSGVVETSGKVDLSDARVRINKSKNGAA